MRKATVFLLLLLGSTCAMAQSIAVLSKGSSALSPYPKEKPSAFIHPQMDTTALQFVATYQVTAPDSLTRADDLFLLIKKKARNDGANCFRLNGLAYDRKSPVLAIDAFFATDAVLASNAALYATNTIYIFSSGGTANDSFSLKINDQARTFNNLQYLKYTLTEGQELKLSKGGFTGAKARLKYEKAKPPLYLMVFGTKNMGGGPLPPAGSVGVTFTTGQIKEMTDDYGQFMVLTLTQAY